MARIYISSTYSDLAECREAVYRALRSMGHDIVAMEDYVAADQRPLDKCLADVASCDLYVGIIAWRYGFIPATDNPERKSITELEFRHAVAKGIPCLLFLLDENAPWPRAKMEQGTGAKKLKLLRAGMSADYTVSFFKDCQQVALQASAAVANHTATKTPSTGGLSKPAPLTPDKISTGRLPVTGRELFGRAEQLTRLDEAWNSHDTHVLSLVAWGGVGKSALVNHWLARMARDDYRGAELVYAWSFYSQGTTDRVVSADQFIEAALNFFGDPDPNQGSPWDKGERLARLVGAQRTLLILDGLEPLQHPPGTDEGRLKDQALQSLLRGLAAAGKGLCLISTRVAVTDLNSFETTTAPRIDLEHLSPEAGAQVLIAQGVKGTQAELEQAAAAFDGHSLALTLLGSYLSDVYGGDVNRRTEVSDLEGDVRYGDRAQKVMASYEKWFGEGRELSVLRMLGLFNRPADRDAIAALRAAPPIPGLTDALQNLNETEWQRVLSKLRRAKLLAEPSPNQPGTLDTHPLVREHFGQQLKLSCPDTWREGNHRLYEHLKNTTKEFPNTIEEMTPLYAAVAHGCEAGKHEEAFKDVYTARILRGAKYYNTYVLGAFEADLAVLASFFELRWHQPICGLTEPVKALIFIIVGFDLRMAGRAAESTQPIQAALKAHISLEDWNNAANDASNLSGVYLVLGDLNQSMLYAKKGIAWAQEHGYQLKLKSNKGSLAAALHQAGRISEAENIFKETEAAQEYRFLYSLTGFFYCDLLLDKGDYLEVQTRALETKQIAEKEKWIFDIPLYSLSLGRAYLLEARQNNTEDFSQAISELNRAVNGLRQAGSLNVLPRGLLARAELYRIIGDFHHAHADLDEAMNIATRGEMRLHEADCYLEYARLHLAQDEKGLARESWEKAKEMIGRMGYHRRDGDVEEIGRELEAAGG
ncbi:MAG: hypothetical protein QOG71_3435 [Pyrinomonadaceae bacterium]|nr:hypothetical protein [Pyrinomonadaceae bacterium]